MAHISHILVYLVQTIDKCHKNVLYSIHKHKFFLYIKLPQFAAQQPRAEGIFRQEAEKEDKMKYGELNLGQVEAIVNKLGGMNGVQRFLSGELVVEGNLVTSTNPTYPITINYGLSLAEMIKVGKYDSVNSDITEKHFPVNGKGTNEVVTELVHFNRFIESDEVIQELDKRGFRPATIEELLAFGTKYPEMQKQFSIVALGSFWQHLGRRHIPFLWCDSNERHLYLHWFEYRWRGNYRFLAVRK